MSGAVRPDRRRRMTSLSPNGSPSRRASLGPTVDLPEPIKPISTTGLGTVERIALVKTGIPRGIQTWDTRSCDQASIDFLGMRVPPARVFFPEEDRAEILARIDHALATGQLTLGATGRELEEAFATRHQVGHAVSVSSGTSALEIILRALDVNGREVLVP